MKNYQNSKKNRPCLRCGRIFYSTGFHNRLCGNCNESIQLYWSILTPPTINQEEEGVNDVHDRKTTRER